ncbi:MAG: PorV/PorQ family protein [candidate division Zixibacteria bacterium]|nr:PorV/PorQ family protein [candidate division Zixibacteria bacterium]
MQQLSQGRHPHCINFLMAKKINTLLSGVVMRASLFPRNVFLIIIALMFLSTVNLAAQTGNGTGTTSGEILNIGIGSRASSLGGAFMAISDDATAPFWNPSGLSSIGTVEFQFGYSSWYQDISVNYLGAVIPVTSKLSTGIGVTYVDYGSFQGYTRDDVPTGDFSGHNAVFSLSLAYQVSRNLSLGLTGKGITEKIEESSASGVAFDVGAIFNTGIFSFGLAAKNVGSGLKYEYENAPLPTKLAAGIGVKTFDGRLRFAGDINIPKDGLVSLHQGVEYLYMKTIFLRGGYVHNFSKAVSSERNGLVYGFGLNILAGSIDYSYIPNDNLGGIHKVDLSLRLNK